MSKSVLISIRPEWCEMIANGKKTVEVRKTRPKLETPFKAYIYCTVGGIKRMPKDYLTESFERGKVIGEFVCDRIDDIMISCSDQNMRGIPFPGTGLTDREIMDYIGNGKDGFCWHISDLVIYDMPKELSEFTGLRKTKFGLEPVSLVRPPQSWCYVEELSGNSGQLGRNEE